MAVDHLRRAGHLTADQEASYLAIDDWFQEHLPNPDFYADGNSIGAVTWFKNPVSAAMQGSVNQMCTILGTHNPGSKRAVAVSSIRHVLFDADGALQTVPGGWYAAMATTCRCWRRRSSSTG